MLLMRNVGVTEGREESGVEECREFANIWEIVGRRRRLSSGWLGLECGSGTGLKPLGAGVEFGQYVLSG
jgi:hypothetical protein